MILLNVIIWTIILTVWVFGTIACAIKGVYHFTEADSTGVSGPVRQGEYQKSAMWWAGCIAIASSALVSLVLWLGTL